MKLGGDSNTKEQALHMHDSRQQEGQHGEFLFAFVEHKLSNEYSFVRERVE